MGAKLLIRVQARSIRLVLIGILFFAGFGLLVKGMKTLGYLPQVSDGVNFGVMLLIMAVVALGLTGKLPAFITRK